MWGGIKKTLDFTRINMQSSSLAENESWPVVWHFPYLYKTELKVSRVQDSARNSQGNCACWFQLCHIIWHLMQLLQVKWSLSDKESPHRRIYSKANDFWSGEETVGERCKTTKKLSFVIKCLVLWLEWGSQTTCVNGTSATVLWAVAPTIKRSYRSIMSLLQTMEHCSVVSPHKSTEGVWGGARV